MMTAFQLVILFTVVISAMMCLAGKPDQKKDGQITLAISGVLFLLSEVLKWLI